MKQNEWNEGINGIDPALVKKYFKQKDKYKQRKKRRSAFLRFGAIAACFAVIVGAVLALPIILGKEKTVPVAYATQAHSDRLSGLPLQFVVGSSTQLSTTVASPPPFVFNVRTFTVKARVVNNLPDVYYKLSTSSNSVPTAYRMIQMETLEVINGDGIPKHFFYMIRESLFVDMSVYDSLIISMSQNGTAGYVMRNGTQSRMEAFPLAVFSDYKDHPELGSIIAFTNGKFDESLWQTESWRFGYQFGKNSLNNPEHSNYVITRKSTEAAAIKEIKKRTDNETPPKVVSLSFTTKAAIEAQKKVEPFKNGVFSQSLQWNDTNNREIVFRRYVNGCPTEETVAIDLETEEVTYSEARYTTDDITELADISAYIAKKANEYTSSPPIPPHTDPEGKDLYSLSLFGWYFKSDNKVYGVVKAVWIYHQSTADYGKLAYYDDAYVLFSSDSDSPITIERDELAKLSDSKYIYQGEYNKPTVIPTY